MSHLTYIIIVIAKNLTYLFFKNNFQCIRIRVSTNNFWIVRVLSLLKYSYYDILTTKLQTIIRINEVIGFSMHCMDTLH